MSQNVELSSFNTRYEGYRLRDDAREARLLADIALHGVEEPLAGVDAPAGRFLLDGFKRYRCAKRLGLLSLPYVSLGEDETAGIVGLMRVPRNRALGALEQARFVVELLTVHGRSAPQVAEMLSRSKGWVSMRRGLLAEMGETIERILFQGKFPVYSYLYTLRRFRRMNSVTRDQVERFVQNLAGQRLSVREIDLLAHGYFRGPPSLRQAIDEGRVVWTLRQMQQTPADAEGCSEFERVLLKDLQLLGTYWQRVLAKCQSSQLNSRAFHAQAHLLAGDLLSRCETFRERIKEFHDRCGRR
jgi:hypothetical protein